MRFGGESLSVVPYHFRNISGKKNLRSLFVVPYVLTRTVRANATCDQGPMGGHTNHLESIPSSVGNAGSAGKWQRWEVCSEIDAMFQHVKLATPTAQGALKCYNVCVLCFHNMSVGKPPNNLDVIVR